MRNYVCDGVLIGKNLKNIRKNAKNTMPQWELAMRTGRSLNTITRCEQGNVIPALDLVFDYMNTFEVDANTALGCTSYGRTNRSVDERLNSLKEEDREYLYRVFHEMIDFHMKRQ